jgi:hypothetical protein
MDLFNTIIGIIGVIPTLAILFIWISKQKPVKKLLNFQEKEPLDIIVTTSNQSENKIGLKVVRPTTGIGQVQGISFAARTLGRFYKRKEIFTHMSTNIPERLSKDLLLIGGPAKNQVTKRFLTNFQTKFSNINFTYDDIDCKLTLDDYVLDENCFRLEDPSKIEKDVGLLILWDNPFYTNRRAILCSGMTSFGTSAVANWFFDDILLQKDKDNFNLIKNMKSFVIVLDIDLLNGKALKIEPIKILNLS